MVFLNIGCGVRKFKNAVNVDIDRNVGPGIVCDCQFLPFQNHSFNFILASHVIEHNKAHNEIIRELIRVCNGTVRIVVPNYLSQSQFNDETHIRALSFRNFRSGLGIVPDSYKVRIFPVNTWVKSRCRFIHAIFILLAKIDWFLADTLIVEILCQ